MTINGSLLFTTIPTNLDDVYHELMNLGKNDTEKNAKCI